MMIRYYRNFSPEDAANCVVRACDDYCSDCLYRFESRLENSCLLCRTSPVIQYIRDTKFQEKKKSSTSSNIRDKVFDAFKPFKEEKEGVKPVEVKSYNPCHKCTAKEVCKFKKDVEDYVYKTVCDNRAPFPVDLNFACKKFVGESK